MIVGELVENLIYLKDSLERPDRKIVELTCNILEKLPRLKEVNEIIKHLSNQNQRRKEAQFTSVLEDIGEVTTSCFVNLETKEVTNVVVTDKLETYSLLKQYITIDGIKYKVTPREDCKDKELEFYY